MSALTAELVRNADTAMCIAALGYVVFDSFSKRVDVSSLKKELDLRRSQLVSKVVNDIEKAVGPLLVAGQPSYDFDDGVISQPLAILDENTRSGLTEVIKQNESYFFEIRLVSKLPIQIQTLNTIIFWLVMAVAIVSAGCVAELIFATVNPGFIWVLIILPSIVVATTAAMAGVRHWKVQNAEKQILKNDSQA